ncbi:aspartic peptidase domain-containing protein [Mycena rebaudengoi]|nr:aspartic peptidase domain-containing protein [Mycena rebaudengoi]
MWLLPIPLPPLTIEALGSSLFLMACSSVAFAFPDLLMNPVAVSSEATTNIHPPLGREIVTTSDNLVVAEQTRNRPEIAGTQSHEATRRSLLPSQDFDLVLHEDGFYTIILDIGTPAQRLPVMLDTTSPYMNMAASVCLNCASFALYNASASSTFVSPAEEGHYPTEMVAIGQFIAHSQKFENRSTRTANVMGLCFNAIPAYGPSFLENTLAQAAVPEIALWLNLAPTGPAAGVLTFGGTNSSLFVGEIEFHNLVGETPVVWQVQLSAITVQGKILTIPDASALCTFDSRQFVIQGPTSEVAAIWAAVPGSSPDVKFIGRYNFPCNIKVNITVSFGGSAWALKPEDLIQGVFPGNSSMCVGSIMGWQGANPFLPSVWAFGTAFLNNVYSIYRQVPPSVGFAQLSPMAGGPLSTTPNSRTSTVLNKSITSTASSSSQTSSSSPPPTKRKSNVGSATGGAVAGLVLMLIGIGVWLSLRRRSKNGDRDHITVFRASPTNDGHRTNSIAAPSNQGGMPMMRSIHKKGQNGAVTHTSHRTHRVADVLTKTPDGLQLITGRAVPADNHHLNSELPNPVDACPAPNVDEVQPPNVASPGGPIDPVIWNELLSLRAEVERVAVGLGSLQAPPSYNSRESVEEDR